MMSPPVLQSDAFNISHLQNKSLPLPPTQSSDPDLSNDFQQQLSLNLPSSTSHVIKKFTFVSLFLSHILNLKDPCIIVQNDIDKPSLNNTQPQIEILNNILFPHDIWVVDGIKIKDAQIKTTMLNEINNMMETECKDVHDQSTFEEITLNYYTKLLIAYKVYDLPTKSQLQQDSFNKISLPNSLREQDEDSHSHKSPSFKEFSFGNLEKPVYRTDSNQSFDSTKKYKRNSSTSSLTKRRLSSFLTSGSNSNNDQSASLPATPNSPPNPSFHQQNQYQSQSQPSSSHTQSLQYSPTPRSEGNYTYNPNSNSNSAINTLLSKSRIYNKIKKHRESSSSMNSQLSNQSLSSSTNSNRTSISTTNTTTSSIGSRRRSNHLNSTLNNSTASSFVSSASTFIPQQDETIYMTKEQKIENRKEKHDYYTQLLRLSKLSDTLISLCKKTESEKLYKFMEFIKKKLLRFILIDVMSMILSYGELRCCKIK